MQYVVTTILVILAPRSSYGNSFCITFTCYVSCSGCLHDHLLF